MAEDTPPMSDDSRTVPFSPGVGGTRSVASEPFAVGDMAGKYRILKRLSAGGMGAVYLAWDAALKRQVAIKVPFTVPQSELHRQQIQGEIEALVKLNHPGIVPVYDLQILGGYPCLVMAYVEGVTLDQYAARSSLSYRAMAELMLQLVAAMAHAHQRHVIHRDLKPGNIIIRHDGHAVVTDFGLAYIRTAYGEHGIAGPGGTIAFMAPEQFQQGPDPITPRTDIFGLGSVLYYLLTGEPPYPGKGEGQRRRAAAAQFRLPRARNESIPAALEKSCLKAMARDPAERFASMEEFSAALREYLGPQPRPDSQAPLTASLEIHFQRASEKGVLHILSERTVPLCTGDRIQVHAQLGAAAHACLIHVDPVGVVSVLHPSGNKPAAFVNRLSVPAPRDLWLPLTEPTGTETILLVANSKPIDLLRVTDIINATLSRAGQSPPLEPACLVWLEAQGPRLVRDETRSLGRPEISDPGPLAHLYRALFRDFHVVSGISFPHVKG